MLILKQYGAYWATVMLYNIELHPLAGFPGPLARAGVHFVGQYSEFTGNEIRDLKALHDKYGDVVRIYPDSLSFNTAQAAKDASYATYGLVSHTDNPHRYIWLET